MLPKSLDLAREWRVYFLPLVTTIREPVLWWKGWFCDCAFDECLEPKLPWDGLQRSVLSTELPKEIPGFEFTSGGVPYAHELASVDIRKMQNARTMQGQ